MVSIVGLWLPILVSAVIVFIVSALFHTALPLHRNDFKRLPDEDGVLDALRPFQVPPGDYMMPRAVTAADMRSEAFRDRMRRGPVAIMTVYPAGLPRMGESLTQWFAYCLLVGVFAAYVAGRALGPGAPYLAVFRFAGVTAFASYFLALLQLSIWFKRNWATTLRYAFGGLVYALLTGGVFGWLWPQLG